MIHWIESHGMESILVAFLFSLVTSVMPQYGTPKFFRLWAYNVVVMLGANAGNLAKHTQAGQKLEGLIGTAVESDSAKSK